MEHADGLDRLQRVAVDDGPEAAGAALAIPAYFDRYNLQVNIKQTTVNSHYFKLRIFFQS